MTNTIGLISVAVFVVSLTFSCIWCYRISMNGVSKATRITVAVITLVLLVASLIMSGIFLLRYIDTSVPKDEVTLKSTINEDDKYFEYYTQYLAYEDYVLSSSNDPELIKEVEDTSGGVNSFRYKTIVKLLITNEGFSKEEAEKIATAVEAEIDKGEEDADVK